MKVSWSYRLKVQHWRAVWSRAVCKFKSHQITLELPANLCNGHQVRSTMRNKLRGFSGPPILFGEIHVQADVHCKVLWWPNQGVIKIHDHVGICRHHIAKQHLWSTDAAPQKKMESKVEQPLKPTIINCFWTIMILTLQRQPQMINPKSGD